MIYAITVFIFSFFPLLVSPHAAHMNLSCLMTGAIVLFSVIYYYLHAMKVHPGPLVEIANFQVLRTVSLGI